MSKKVEGRFFDEEDTKCPPQYVHRSNSNEVRASYELEDRISGARSGGYPFEPSMRIEEDENRAKRHQHKHKASSTSSPNNEQRNIEKAIAMEEGSLVEEKKKITEAYSPYEQHPPTRPIPNEYRASSEGREAAHYTSGGRHKASSIKGPDTSPGAEPVENVGRAHHPYATSSTREQELVFPGAIREGGLHNEEGNDEDDLTLESRTDLIPPTIAAELVNMEEEERLVQDQINEALERERQLVQDQINEALENERQKAVVAEVVSSRGRRWKLMVAILLLLTAIAVAVGITQRPVPTQSPTPVPTPSQEDLSDLLSSVSSDGGKALQTASTHQNMAFEWLVNDASYTNETLIQRYALATLFFSTNGDSWNNHTFWLSNENICHWHGVICANDSVKELALWAKLTGELPPEIGLLSNTLDTLVLAFNELEHTIPTEMGQLKHLNFLVLDNNTLTGTIPTEINSLGSLKWLSLYGNMLTGSYRCPDYFYYCTISCSIFSGIDTSNMTEDSMDTALQGALENLLEYVDDPVCESL